MISDNEPLINQYISVPKEMNQLNCGAFVAGIIEGCCCGLLGGEGVGGLPALVASLQAREELARRNLQKSHPKNESIPNEIDTNSASTADTGKTEKTEKTENAAKAAETNEVSSPTIIEDAHLPINQPQPPALVSAHNAGEEGGLWPSKTVYLIRFSMEVVQREGTK